MRSRRDLIKLGALAAAAGVANACGGSSASSTSSPTAAPAPPRSSAPPTARPNVLLLCIDDLNDWTGHLGGYAGTVHTPNIDELASESVDFRRAYCTVPICKPSRASVLWSRRPESTGFTKTGLVSVDPAYQVLIGDELDASLPRVMAAHGYETLTTGKVTHAFIENMWETWLPYPEISELLTATAESRQTGFDFGLIEDGQTHPDQVAADWMSDQLLANRSRPLFAALGLFQPHVPWRLPKWAFDLYPLDEVIAPEPEPDDLNDLPPEAVELALNPQGQFAVIPEERIADSGRRDELVQAYLAAISHTDAMVGQVLDALNRSPQVDDTVVILWSDHGYHLGEKLHWRKATLWERATRVPFLLRDPGASPAQFETPVSLLDLAPTVLDAAGLPPHPSFEGASLYGSTEHAAAERIPSMMWGEHRSIRAGQWRYTKYSKGGEELYDLASDPGEINNLAEDPAQQGTLVELRPLMET